MIWHQIIMITTHLLIRMIIAKKIHKFLDSTYRSSLVAMELKNSCFDQMDDKTGKSV